MPSLQCGVSVRAQIRIVRWLVSLQKGLSPFSAIPSYHAEFLLALANLLAYTVLFDVALLAEAKHPAATNLSTRSAYTKQGKPHI